MSEDTVPQPVRMVPTPGRVSVVIVSWNSGRFLPGCLDSLSKQTLPPYEVVVVDNGSTDSSVEIVGRHAPSATVIPLGENTGYCRANNEGFARSRGDAVLFLNPDVVLDPAFLAEAIRPFDSDERIGSVSGKLLRFDAETLDSAGQCLSRSRRIVERGYGRPDEGQFERGGYIFSVCGAAALYRRLALEDVTDGQELFDTDFFTFSEDIDLGWRARNAGWRAWYEPRAVGRHFRGGTAAAAGVFSSRAAMLRRPAELRYHILKNRYLMLIKNDRPAHILRDLRFIAPREVALAALAVASGPRVLGRLTLCGALLGRALRKRRDFLAEQGVWGKRRCGLPAAWAGERLLDEGSLPRPQDTPLPARRRAEGSSPPSAPSAGFGSGERPEKAP